ncbi:MAG: hypothetical protein ACK42Y_02840 [Candidatus Thermochlorobacter sp.]
MSSLALSALPKAAVTHLQKAFPISFESHRSIKVTLLFSAATHFTEFIICVFFFNYAAAPYFVPPIATPIDGSDSFLYAHSIIRQYGFFVVQLALVAAFLISEPARYTPFIYALALARLLMAALGLYAYTLDALSLWQFLPSLILNVGLAFMLWRLAPASLPLLSRHEALQQWRTQTLLGLSLSPLVRWRTLQLLCIIAGGLWILWGLGSTVLWEIGVANISSDSVTEQNLLQAMQANHVVRNQQGLMLFSIGLITAWAARHPLSYCKIMDFILAQQVINAFSAGVELGFGAILLPQFLTVFSVQVFTFGLFYMLRPNSTHVEIDTIGKEAMECNR